jgi:predicted  nucleic acid-binding Zn-ribbon protein
MHPSKQLFQLQTLDLERDAKYRRLKAVIAALAEPEALRGAAEAVSVAQADVAHARTRRKGLELEVKTLEAKIASVEERLYSGRVKNPKELTDLQNDSAALRRHHATLDDALLEAMIGLEDGESRERQAQSHLADLQSEWQSNEKKLTEERGQLEAELAALTEQRNQKIAAVAPDLVPVYQRLRHEHAGLVVGRVEEGMCSACGEEISDHLLFKARLSEGISFCGNCGRILLVE